MTNCMKWLPIIIMIIISFAGCDNTAKSVNNGVVTGKVMSNFQRKLDNNLSMGTFFVIDSTLDSILVRLYDKNGKIEAETRTKDGYYRFVGLKGGDYHIKASISQYILSDSVNVRLVDDSTVTADSILFKFKDENNDPENKVIVYPNPANRVVNVEFDVMISNTVSLNLYSLSGRKIKNLLDEQLLVAGKHQISFDMAELNLSEGLYYAVLMRGSSAVYKPVLYLFQ